MRHPVRGLLIGPLVAPAGYWLGAMAHALVTGFRVDFFQAVRELGVVALFGLPIAYAIALAWGAPVLYALHRLGWLRAAPVIAAGALGGALVALCFALAQQGALIRVHMPLLGAVVLGGLAGAACWWAGQGKAA